MKIKQVSTIRTHPKTSSAIDVLNENGLKKHLANKTIAAHKTINVNNIFKPMISLSLNW